jgi:hypothetical protein
MPATGIVGTTMRVPTSAMKPMRPEHAGAFDVSAATARMVSC